MGNLSGVLRSQKTMQIPRDIFELADGVTLPENSVDVDEAIKLFGWTRAFLLSPALLDPIGGPDRVELFTFLVSCSLISKINDKNRKQLLSLLELIRERFFSDDQLWKANIALKDIRNVQDEIFRFYYIDGVEKNVALLKSNLLTLRQDKAIRSSLEPKNLVLH